jgi:hypothetical protein
VEVFYDENQNGVWNRTVEYGIDSEYFIVKALTMPTLTVAVSDAIGVFSIPGMTQAQLHAAVDLRIINSFDMALSRDSADDNRALIRPVIGTITQVTIPQEPLDTEAKHTAVLNANYAFMVFVDSMSTSVDPNHLNNLRGLGVPAGNMLVNWNPSVPAPETIVHEYGHTKRLEHGSAGVDPNNIMCGGTAEPPAPARIPGANRLNPDQIDNFEE